MALRFTLRQLEYFVAVGETGSIALASEQVNVSSPSISTSISQLEAELGVQLFIRKHAHGLSLTSGGRRVLAEARALLDSAAGLSSLAADISESVSGPLAIGCLKTIAPMVLADLRRRFENLYPGVSVRQTEGDHAALLRATQNAEIDVCLTYDLGTPNDLQFEPLAELPPYVMLAASHPLAGQTGITPEELVAEPMVLLDLPFSSDYFLSVFSRTGLKPTIAERSGDLALVRSMVANGFGYSLANIRSRSETAPDGKPLKFVPLTGGPRPMKIGLITSRESRKTRLLGAFEDHCREIVHQGGIPGLTMV